MRTAVIGSKSIGLQVAEMLAERSQLTAVISIDDRLDMRSRFSDFHRFKQASFVSSREAVHALRAVAADFVVVAGWYWLIPPDIVANQRLIGIHHSLLPRYRGGSPLVWALINGEDVVGTSLFSLAEGIDDGPIWAQREVPVGDGYIQGVMESCDAAALQLIDVLFDSDARPFEQAHEQATYVPLRHPEDGLIDWSRPGAAIVRWIRAQSRPYPGAFTYHEGERVTIWRARLDSCMSQGIAGTVIGDKIVAGDGTCVVVEDTSARIRQGFVGGIPTTPDMRGA